MTALWPPSSRSAPWRYTCASIKDMQHASLDPYCSLSMSLYSLSLYCDDVTLPDVTNSSLPSRLPLWTLHRPPNRRVSISFLFALEGI